MRKSRFSEEQIIGVLREQEVGSRTRRSVGSVAERAGDLARPATAFCNRTYRVCLDSQLQVTT